MPDKALKLLEKISGVLDKFWTFITNIPEKAYDSLAYIMKEMVDLLIKFPRITSFPEIIEVWQVVLVLSLSMLGLVFIYIAVRNRISLNSNIIRSIEIKQVIARTFYMGFFIILSRTFVDWLIMLNNVLINVLMHHFDIRKVIDHIGNSHFGKDIIATAIIGYQIYLVVWIMIQYWLRVTEVLVMYVSSPVMYLLWVNPEWGGYLSSWLKRISSLIFTQLAQILILIIHGHLVFKFFVSGSISSLALGVAGLILMKKTPAFFKMFIAQTNSLQIMTGTYDKISNSNTVKKIKNKMSGGNDDDE
jgi:hypothetical protein